MPPWGFRNYYDNEVIKEVKKIMELLNEKSKEEKK